MTDVELIHKRLGLIEKYVRELEESADVGKVGRDTPHTLFVTAALQHAIQFAIDVASHVIAYEELGEPASNRGAFALISTRGWMDEPLREKMEKMAGFRNILVHEYIEVDYDKVRDVLENNLGDFREFTRQVRTKLAALA